MFFGVFSAIGHGGLGISLEKLGQELVEVCSDASKMAVWGAIVSILGTALAMQDLRDDDRRIRNEGNQQKGVRGQSCCRQGVVGRDGFFRWLVFFLKCHLGYFEHTFWLEGTCLETQGIARKKKLGIYTGFIFLKTTGIFQEYSILFVSNQNNWCNIVCCPTSFTYRQFYIQEKPRQVLWKIPEAQNDDDDSSRLVLRYMILPANHAYIRIACMATCFQSHKSFIKHIRDIIHHCFSHFIFITHYC